jgi:arylsulfate sulfotransferase
MHFFLIKPPKILLILSMLLMLASSCNDEGLTFIKDPVVVKNQNNSAPLTAFVDFETSNSLDSIFIKISDGERFTHLAYDTNDKYKSGYLIKYMAPDRNQIIKLGIKDQSGVYHDLKDSLIFNTAPLPKDDLLFPKIEISKNELSSGEVLTLINPRRRIPVVVPGSNKFNALYGLLVIVNQKGEVLWYYQTDSRISDFDILPNGNISFITQDNRIREIDFSGEIINEWYASQRPENTQNTGNEIPVDTPTFHHDTALLNNGNRLVLSTEIREIDNYYTSERNRNAPRKKQNVVGDVVIEFNPEGKIVHQWKAFDHMPVMRIGYETFSNYWIRRGFPDAIDWSHANAIVPVDNDESYLVNFRYQSAILKVHKKSGKIDWIFAEKSGWGEALQDKLLKIPANGLNWHQHSPRCTKSGGILFFNNNNYQSRPFEKTKSIIDSPSYVVEYKIDEESREVQKIWSTENDGMEKVYSIAMGRVSELENSGNILACYGALLDPKYFDEMDWWNRIKYPQWTMVREYTKTTKPIIVWEMRLHPLTENSKVSWTLFGAERIGSSKLPSNHH